MKSTLPAVERLIYGYLLEEGIPIADGFGILNPDGTGTFKSTESESSIDTRAQHSIEEWEGSIWPLTDVCQSVQGGGNYVLSHAMLGIV